MPLIEIAGPIAIPGQGKADALLAKVAGQTIERLD